MKAKTPTTLYGISTKHENDGFDENDRIDGIDKIDKIDKIDILYRFQDFDQNDAVGRFYKTDTLCVKFVTNAADPSESYVKCHTPHVSCHHRYGRSFNPRVRTLVDGICVVYLDASIVDYYIGLYVKMYNDTLV